MLEDDHVLVVRKWTADAGIADLLRGGWNASTRIEVLYPALARLL